MKELITDEYLQLNQRLHREQAGYGGGGWRWVGPALRLAQNFNCKSILDYGSGKGSFQTWFPTNLGIEVCSYDPATASTDPKPRDLVMCIDVLEHIEPPCLNAVLDHLRSKARIGALLLISTRKANKTLANGRNAHLIVESESWWAERLASRFQLVASLRSSHPELVRGDETLFWVEP